MEQQIKPAMTDKEIECIEKYLRPEDVMLEWGAGGSTIYFGQRVGSYYSIEDEGEYLDKIRDTVKRVKLEDKIHLICVPKNDKIWLEQSTYQEYRDYVETIGRISNGLKFNRILIDGRVRFYCAIKALDYLTEDGLVFIHDFYRRHYYYGVLFYYDVVEEIREGNGLVVLKKKDNKKVMFSDVSYHKEEIRKI